MTAPTNTEAACPGCSRRYRLRAEAVGRKVKCDCGAVFEVGRPGGSSEPQVSRDDLELDAFAHEPKASSRKPADSPSLMAVQEMPPAALPRSHSPVAMALLNREDDTEVSSLRERWAPLAVLIVGFPLHLALWNHWISESPRLLVVEAIALTVQLLLFLPAMFASLMLAARWMDVTLGALRPMLWKMSALTFGPAAVADVLFTVTLILSNFDWEVIAAGFGFHLVLVGAVSIYLFELSIAQMAFFVTLNFAVRVAVAYPAAALLHNFKWIH